MPRRELLTSSEREQLLALPRDDGALLRIATFSREDLAFIGQHRGDHNRLGIGIQLCYLRHPGRALGSDETPHAQLLGLVAAQLRFLLMFGIFTPIAIKRAASIYKRFLDASVGAMESAKHSVFSVATKLSARALS